MRTSENITELAKALIQFQKEAKNPTRTAQATVKTRSGMEYSYGYAPLPEVVDTIRPLLAKHGLAIIQNAHGEDKTIGITTLLVHESGQWVEGEPLSYKHEDIRDQQGRPLDVMTPQKAGALVTYLRRYSLSPFLGLADEEDSDAARIEEEVRDGPKKPPLPPPAKPPPKLPPQKKEPEPGKTITEKQQKFLYAIAKEARAETGDLKKITQRIAGTEHLKEITMDKVNDVVAHLEARKEFLEKCTGDYGYSPEDIKTVLKDAFGLDTLADCSTKQIRKLQDEIEQYMSAYEQQG